MKYEINMELEDTVAFDWADGTLVELKTVMHKELKGEIEDVFEDLFHALGGRLDDALYFVIGQK